MVGFPVTLPVKEDDLSCLWRKAAVLPLPSVLKPLRAVDAACKLGDNAAVDIATLVGTPRNEAGTPFHTPVKTVPIQYGSPPALPTCDRATVTIALLIVAVHARRTTVYDGFLLCTQTRPADELLAEG